MNGKSHSIPFEAVFKKCYCSRCGIDAIVPDSIDEKIDNALICEMHEYWF